MPLVGKRDVGDGHAALLEGSHHLLRFRGDHPDIAHALCDQDRLGRAFEVVDRRAFGEKGAAGFGVGIAEPIFPDAEPRSPIGRYRRHEGDEIGDAEDIDDAGEHFRRLGGRRQRGIAAIASTEEPDTLGIGDALRDCPIDRIDQIVMHPPAPFAVGGLDERLAEAGRAPVVDAQHRVTAIGEPLMDRIEPPDIAGIGTAMDHQYQRHPATCRILGRQCQIGVEVQTIAGRNDHRLHLPQGNVGERLALDE